MKTEETKVTWNQNEKVSYKYAEAYLYDTKNNVDSLNPHYYAMKISTNSYWRP